jgi:hypothetical protein
MSTNNLDTLNQLSIVCGPLQLLIYLGLVFIVLRAGDKIAKRRWITMILISGLPVLLISVLGPILYVLSHYDDSPPINLFQIGKDFGRLSLLTLCTLMPAAFIGTMMGFSRIDP